MAAQIDKVYDFNRLPLLRAHLDQRPKDKHSAHDVECSAPDCQRVISFEAAQRTKFCGPCQMRVRELRSLIPGYEMSDTEIELFWIEDRRFKVSEAASFLGIKQRSLYSLIARGAVESANLDETITISRDDLIGYARSIRGILGLRDAAEAMDVDYGYLRELVRRGAIKADKTFWGHYGLSKSRLEMIRTLIQRALPKPDDYNLVSFSEALGVHHSVIQRMIKNGLIRYRKGVTGRISIPKSEFRRLKSKVEKHPDSVPNRVRSRLAQ